MKHAILLIAGLSLVACETPIPLPGGTEAVTTVGYYAPTPPEEGGELGAFTKFRKKAPVIEAEK